ncbi:hypothetical protein EPO33_01860 [Patescibacteria group bacterium]|nr:MAG: hypothetical protein EPO33_01860 [Patescibacteria group bacterium]
MSERSGQNPEAIDAREQKQRADFDRLVAIVEFLRQEGFRVCDDLVTYEMMTSEIAQRHATPMVWDGSQGIRYKYDPYRGLIISFTNGFEEPDDPRRVRIVKWAKEKGFGDIVVGGQDYDPTRSF